MFILFWSVNSLPTESAIVVEIIISLASLLRAWRRDDVIHLIVHFSNSSLRLVLELKAEPVSHSHAQNTAIASCIPWDKAQGPWKALDGLDFHSLLTSHPTLCTSFQTPGILLYLGWTKGHQSCLPSTCYSSDQNALQPEAGMTYSSLPSSLAGVDFPWP